MEADGHGFHDVERDRQRDAALRELGVEAVLRFTGSAIVRDAAGCAAEVARYLAQPSAHCTVRRPAPAFTLDASQQRAAAHGIGAARVLAPAGSGKTTTMIHHVEALLERGGVAPRSILVLAFNKKAADQLTARLGEVGIPVTDQVLDPERDAVLCATFNAFGYRHQKAVIGDRWTVEPEARFWRTLMERALHRAGVNVRALKPKRGSDPIGEFQRGLARVRAGLELPADITIEIESFGDTPGTLVPFDTIYPAFEETQLRARRQSFDDQIYLAVRDLLAVPEHRPRIQQRYEHGLVDEFQDLSGAQLALADIVSRPHRNLFAVGDDDQLIYGWRFADTTNILDFHERMPPAPYSATYTLSTNYRCSQAVVAASRRLIDHNQIREPKAISAAQNAPAGRVVFCAADDWQVRRKELCRFLEDEYSRSPQQRWRALAVLCRYKAQQPLVAMALDAAGIPRSTLLTYRLYTHPAAELLRGYLTLVREPARISGERLAYLLNRPNRYLRNADVARITEAAHPWDALVAWAEAGAPRGVGTLIEQAQKLQRVLDHKGPRADAALAMVLDAFALERYWVDEAKPAGGREQDEAGPMQVVEVLRTHAAEFASLDDFLTEWDGRAEQEAARFDMMADELVREEPEDRDEVVISTMHAAKGREYHAVVIVDYDADLRHMTHLQQEEERRVLYVGVTPAKEAVLLTVDTGKPAVHPYIKELIAPPEPQEEQRLRSELARLRDDEHRTRVEVARHEDELAARQQQVYQRITELEAMKATGGWQGFL